MKRFKPRRSCNSACIASHQDYDDDNNDEDDDDDADDDDDEDDNDNDDEDEISIVTSFLSVLFSKLAHFSWTDVGGRWELGNFGIMKTVTSKIMGVGHFSSFIFRPSAPNVPLSLL